MKKIKSIYILFVFAAISSYGLWACTNSKTTETVSNDPTQVIGTNADTISQAALDSLPVEAAVDTDFYIKMIIEGKEHTFNYLTLDKADGNNIITPNLFRMKRCEDEKCKNTFYIQAHNFDLNEKTPLTLEENTDGDRSKKIILSFITRNKDAKQNRKLKPEDVMGTKIIINKIEGDVYEGSFSTKIKQGLEQDSLSGSFRMKMVVQKPAA
jgi:hypothetical protein